MEEAPAERDRVTITGVGRRERKKAQVRAHISDVATRLFAQFGFDAVSVSEIAAAADVARPTVFAYFPRKEDLVFDRYGDVAAALVQAARHSAFSVRAVLDLLSTPTAAGAAGSTNSEQLGFWRLVANSRALQARAQELAREMEQALADALGERGIVEPALCAAFIAAAYRTVHLDAIRRLLAGESSEVVLADRTRRLEAAFDAVEVATSRIGAPRSLRRSQ